LIILTYNFSVITKSIYFSTDQNLKEMLDQSVVTIPEKLYYVRRPKIRESIMDLVVEKEKANDITAMYLSMQEEIDK